MDAHMEMVNHCHCVSACVNVIEGKSGKGSSVGVHILVWESARSNKGPKNSRNLPM